MFIINTGDPNMNNKQIWIGTMNGAGVSLKGNHIALNTFNDIYIGTGQTISPKSVYIKADSIPIKGKITSDRTNDQITEPDQLVTKRYVDSKLGSGAGGGASIEADLGFIPRVEQDDKGNKILQNSCIWDADDFLVISSEVLGTAKPELLKPIYLGSTNNWIETHGKITSDRTNNQITEPDQLVTKRYVDSKLGSGGGGYTWISEDGMRIDINPVEKHLWISNAEKNSYDYYDRAFIYFDPGTAPSQSTPISIKIHANTIGITASEMVNINNARLSGIKVMSHNIDTISTGNIITGLYSFSVITSSATSYTIYNGGPSDGSQIYVCNKSGNTITVAGKSMPNNTVSLFVKVGLDWYPLQ